LLCSLQETDEDNSLYDNLAQDLVSITKISAAQFGNSGSLYFVILPPEAFTNVGICRTFISKSIGAHESFISFRCIFQRLLTRIRQDIFQRNIVLITVK